MLKIKKIITLAIVFSFFPSIVFASLIEPNDEFYNFQKEYFSQIRLQEAWGETTGIEDVVIAVIDSGVDIDHPDIMKNMWFNKGEISLNGIDDDRNGYIDDLNGWDFIIESSDPHPKIDEGYSSTAVNHGTAVAGIVASVANNSIGLSGVCWNCKIMALRAIDSTGLGEMATIAKAVNYAVDNGADIINMSFVGNILDDVLSGAVSRAYESGVVIVSAVGNDADNFVLAGGDLDFNPVYPVCFDGGQGSNHVLGVGSVELNNTKSPFSNYGFSCIDINAPGSNIAVLQLYDPKEGDNFSAKYVSGWSGTSLSAPIASGVAGLIKSTNPKLTNSQIMSIIRSTGVNIDNKNIFYTGQLGSGLLDAKAAVDSAKVIAGLGSGTRTKQVFARTNILISSGAGRNVEAIISDKDGKEAARWLAYPEFFKGGAELVSGDVDGDGEVEIIAGAGYGGGPQVRVFNNLGNVESQFFAYDTSFRGGVHVASGDIDGDGVWEIITSAGGGFSSEIKIFNKSGRLINSFKVSAKNLSGGITVTTGDIDNDGQVDIITGTGGGSLPMVQVFDILGNIKDSWMAYPEFFRGGVDVAIGDIDGDGNFEIVTSAGYGGGPQIRIFEKDGKVKGQFFAFEESFRGGANVTVGNIDNDLDQEIIVGSGAGREAEIRVFRLFGSNFVQESVFGVFENNYKGGVNVGI